MNNALVRTAALAVCLSVVLPGSSSAVEFTYQLVIKKKLETGEEIEMIGGYAEDLFACKREKKKIQIGRKFPRGLIVRADGSSPAGTNIGVRCQQRPGPRLGM